MKNLGQMLKQAQEMQARMAEMQAKLAEVEMSGNAGGGMVQVTLNGKGEMRRVKIDKALMVPDEAEVLEDLIVAATNDAKSHVEAYRAAGDVEAHRRPAIAAGYEAAVLSGQPLIHVIASEAKQSRAAYEFLDCFVFARNDAV